MSPLQNKLTVRETALVRKAAGELFPKLSPAYLGEVFVLAVEKFSLDFRAALSRLYWLDRNHYFSDKKKSDLAEGKSPEQMAELLAFPKSRVLSYLAKHGPLESEKLESVYGTLHRREDPAALAELAEERILDAMRSWLLGLHLPRYYFERTAPAEIARHILLNRAYKIQARSGEAPPVNLHFTGPLGTQTRWFDGRRLFEVEDEIEETYYRAQKIYNFSCYPLRGEKDGSLFLYLGESRDDDGLSEAFASCGPDYLVRHAPMEIRRRYERLWEKTRRSQNIEIETSKKSETGEYRLMIAFPKFTIRHFFSNVTRVLQRYDIQITRKYVSAFGGKNPVLVSAYYSKKPFPKDILGDLISVSLYPPNRLADLVNAFQLSPDEANFGSAAIYFLRQFITVPVSDLTALEKKFPGDRELGELLRGLQRKSDKDAFSEAELTDFIHDKPAFLKEAYALFRSRFHPREHRPELFFSAQKEKFLASVESGLSREQEKLVWQWVVRFIESIARTNFFLVSKGALSFFLKQGFLRGGGYESEPHGVIFVVSKTFYGFHIRFEEIARGGIRILHSRTLDQLERNGRSLFEECFSLALTQQKKNKDIPEGGAKGVLLLTQLTPAGSDGREHAASAFKKYVDAVLDLLLPSGKNSIRFFPKEPELLFFGPDEGTAELMDWAARRARERGYPHWLSFTTGKSAELGGISHIDYGITTRGVREYVHELLRTLKIPEASVTKVQTGGPDGDLGSNEILFSRDKTIAVVDGSGVLYDPKGLDRAELCRLAKKRVTASHFSTRLLGNGGFLVRVEDAKVRLPGGELVANGEVFRNQFHLHPMLRADLFVPCGGRPKSVNLSNWEKLLDEKGAPRFRWIVEGANLFITQEARIKLEERGAILFKDSSTNKGGVTSSSLEVLASLALPDGVFLRNLTQVKNRIPASRKKFVAEVCDVIVQNARQEFGLLWREWKEKGGSLSRLSDELSERIISMTHEMSRAGLADDPHLRDAALRRHIPASLLRLTSLKSQVSKIPSLYLRAVVNRTLAKEFVYQHGLHAGFEAYREFIEDFGSR